MKKQLILLLALFTLSCNHQTPEEPTVPDAKDGSLFICNEGNFMYGNASLSVYNPDDKSVANQIFYSANNFPLGDVLQSMTIIGNRGYLVMNNSGKVIVMDINTYQYIGTIKGLTSPRYIEQVNDTKIYISDLYSNTIAVVNPQTFEVTGQIEIGKGTEQMVRSADYIYVCSWSFNNQIFRIDTRTDKLAGALTVTKQPNSMVLDKNGKIWVLSDGGYPGSPYAPEIAALTRIDPTTFTIEQQFDFPDIKASPSELCINSAADTIYYINGGFASDGTKNGLCRMGVNDTKLETIPFIPENGRLFYGVAIDPKTSEVYISDAIDYVQKGIVLHYSADGKELKDQFKVDIIPGAFCFKPER